MRTARIVQNSHRSLLFSHRAVLETKKTAKMSGSKFFRSDRMVWSEFQNHDANTEGIMDTDFFIM